MAKKSAKSVASKKSDDAGKGSAVQDHDGPTIGSFIHKNRMVRIKGSEKAGNRLETVIRIGLQATEQNPLQLGVESRMVLARRCGGQGELGIP